MDTVVDSKAVNDCLDKIRPYIQHDGGDIELLGVDEFNVVYGTGTAGAAAHSL